MSDYLSHVLRGLDEIGRYARQANEGHPLEETAPTHPQEESTGLGQLAENDKDGRGKNPYQCFFVPDQCSLHTDAENKDDQQWILYCHRPLETHVPLIVPIPPTRSSPNLIACASASILIPIPFSMWTIAA